MLLETLKIKFVTAHPTFWEASRVALVACFSHAAFCHLGVVIAHILVFYYRSIMLTVCAASLTVATQKKHLKI